MKIVFVMAALSSIVLSQGVRADSVMQVQLPFYDGEAYRCTQNSDDTPTHNKSSTLFDLDFNMKVGDIVVAAADGVLHHGSNPGGFGMYARVDHDNDYMTISAHLSSFIVGDGTRVFSGQPIAYSGNSGYVEPKPTKENPNAGQHLHFGVHTDSSGVGESQPMEVWAYNRNTGELGFFSTGKEGSGNRDFVCDQSLSNPNGHTYESRPIGKVFSNFSCRKLSGSNGVLCWYLNPTTCEDGQSHVRYFRNPQGAMQSESKSDTWRWCLEDTGQSANIFSFLEGGYGVGGSDDSGGTSNPSTQTDLVPNPKVYDDTTGRLFNENEALPSGVRLKFVGGTKAIGANASIGMRSGVTSVTVRWEIKIGNGTWTRVENNQTIHKANLTKDNEVERVWHYTIPITVLNKNSFSIRFIVDTEDVVMEKNENNERTKEFAILNNLEWFIPLGNFILERPR